MACQSVAQTVRGRFCHPTATYRLQFGPGKMTFRDAAGIVPYLDELGISHLYASPYLKARTGSPHGYAIVDYTQLNPELGVSTITARWWKPCTAARWARSWMSCPIT